MRCRCLPALFVAAWLSLLPACEKKPRPCPEGLELDSARSTPGEQLWCKSPDGSRARWLQFHRGGEKQKQSCGFSGGQAEGSYLAWHENGRVFVEGRYKEGRKIGKWSQWSEAGALIARGEYRFGNFVAGAPVGTQASCDKLKP